MINKDGLRIKHYIRDCLEERICCDSLRKLYDDVDKFVENLLEPEDYEEYILVKPTLTDECFDLFYYQRRIDKKKKLEFGDDDVRNWFQIMQQYPEHIKDVLIETIEYIKDNFESGHYSQNLADRIRPGIFEEIEVCRRDTGLKGGSVA